MRSSDDSEVCSSAISDEKGKEMRERYSSQRNPTDLIWSHPRRPTLIITRKEGGAIQF